MKTDSDVKRVPYQCSRCASEDVCKLFSEEMPPVAFNCWKCHAGRGMDLDVMLQTRTGMFMVPVTEAEMTEVGGVA
jgi:hypothetical protein